MQRNTNLILKAGETGKGRIRNITGVKRRRRKLFFNALTPFYVVKLTNDTPSNGQMLIHNKILGCELTQTHQPESCTVPESV